MIFFMNEKETVLGISKILKAAVGRIKSEVEVSEAQTRLLHNYNAVGTSEVESSYDGSEVVFH